MPGVVVQCSHSRRHGTGSQAKHPAPRDKGRKNASMKKFTVYNVYIDDGRDAFRVTVPAPSKKEAAAYVQGNGDVVAIAPASLQDIDLDCLADTLRRSKWGQEEIDVITRTLAAVGLDR